MKQGIGQIRESYLFLGTFPRNTKKLIVINVFGLGCHLACNAGIIHQPLHRPESKQGCLEVTKCLQSGPLLLLNKYSKIRSERMSVAQIPGAQMEGGQVCSYLAWPTPKPG